MVDDNIGNRGLAGYIRVSSANPDAQRSIAAQKQGLDKIAQEHGFGIGTVVWYVDEGSGVALPALQALLADARSPDRDFDAVLVCSYSRFSRNLTHGIMVRRALQDAGVDVHSLAEGEENPRLAGSSG